MEHHTFSNRDTARLKNKWKLSMGWCYMIICLFDFLVAPLLWSIWQGYMKGDITSQWSPLTLQGAGLFHLAMGAILGIEAFNKNVLSSNQNTQRHNNRQEKTSTRNVEVSDDVCE